MRYRYGRKEKADATQEAGPPQAPLALPADARAGAGGVYEGQAEEGQESSGAKGTEETRMKKRSGNRKVTTVVGRLSALESWAADLVAWAVALGQQVARLERRLGPENLLAALVLQRPVALPALQSQALTTSGGSPGEPSLGSRLLGAPLESIEPKVVETNPVRSAPVTKHKRLLKGTVRS